ncbi:hypothetical protein D3C77_700340 [compost metagenome]
MFDKLLAQPIVGLQKLTVSLLHRLPVRVIPLSAQLEPLPLKIRFWQTHTRKQQEMLLILVESILRLLTAHVEALDHINVKVLQQGTTRILVAALNLRLQLLL